MDIVLYLEKILRKSKRRGPEPKEYGVYDMKKNELLVMLGTMTEIGVFFNKNTMAIRNTYNKKYKIEGRYEIIEIEKE